MFGVDIKSGIHELSGINYYTGQLDWYNESSNGICFILDGKHYYALEDPVDGYRSMMVVEAANEKKICKRKFPPQKVEVVHEDYKPDRYYDSPNDLLCIFNPNDNSLILRIETEHYDSYYPCAVWEYHPENLPINKN